MRWFKKVLVILLIIPAQTLLLEKFQIVGVKPDLALVFVFVQGWIGGKKPGIYWGLVLGGLIDLFSIGVLGLNLVIKVGVGLFAGLLGESFLHLSLQSYVLIFLFVSLIHDISGFIFLHGVGSDGLSSVIMGEVFIRALYNTLLVIGSYLFVWQKLDRKGVVEYGGAIFSPGRKPGLRE